MKKLLLLGLGLSLVLSAFIFAPHASRDAYHVYLQQQMLESGRNRRFTGRNFRVDQTFVKKNIYRNQRTIAIRKSRLFPTQAPRTNRPALTSRAMSQRYQVTSLSPKASLVQSGQRFTTKPHTNLPSNWISYGNEDYVLTIPHNVTTTATETEMTFAKKSQVDVTVTITKTNQGSSCANRTFLICARNLTRMNDRQAERKKDLSVEQRHGTSNFQLGTNNQAQYYVETNITNGLAGEEFVTQKIIEGIDGEVFHLEVRSPKNSAHYTIPFANRIFNTFHVK